MLAEATGSLTLQPSNPMAYGLHLEGLLDIAGAKPLSRACRTWQRTWRRQIRRLEPRRAHLCRYLRNGHGQTTATAFSARARPGPGVSMPVTWEQLPEFTSGAHWNVATAPDYAAQRASGP